MYLLLVQGYREHIATLEVNLVSEPLCDETERNHGAVIQQHRCDIHVIVLAVEDVAGATRVDIHGVLPLSDNGTTLSVIPVNLAAKHLRNHADRNHGPAGIHDDRLLVREMNEFPIYEDLDRGIAVVVQVNTVARKDGCLVLGKVKIPVEIGT